MGRMKIAKKKPTSPVDVFPLPMPGTRGLSSDDGMAERDRRVAAKRDDARDDDGVTSRRDAMTSLPREHDAFSDRWAWRRRCIVADMMMMVSASCVRGVRPRKTDPPCRAGIALLCLQISNLAR